MKHKLLVIIKALGKCIIWTALTFATGLAQLWIILLLLTIVPTIRYDFLTDTIREGVLLFFVMALVTTITIDYYFSEMPKWPPWIEGLLFIIFPVVTGIFVAVAYVALFLDREAIDLDAMFALQCGAIILAIAYSLVVKFLSFMTTPKR